MVFWFSIFVITTFYIGVFFFVDNTVSDLYFYSKIKITPEKLDKLRWSKWCAMVIVFISIIMSSISSDSERREKWEEFKKDNNCNLMEVSDSGLWGRSYTWKCSNGLVIKGDNKDVVYFD